MLRFRIAALVVVTLFARLATAQEARSIEDVLHVERDACLTRASLGAAVAFWLQRTELSERVEFDVRRIGPDVVFVTKRDGAVAGERHIQQPQGTCEEVTDAVGLAIALTIDATLLERIGVEPALTEAIPKWSAFSVMLNEGRERRCA